ncbi:MAG: extracellular solute-binding protein [Pseudomonadota bacterium]
MIAAVERKSTARLAPMHDPLKHSRTFLSFGLIVGSLLYATDLHAEQHDETIIVSHGISAFGDLKYPADFTHFEYANPDAPKGGTFSTWAFGSFDSLHPYVLKGNAARSAVGFFDSLLVAALDEPDSYYGLLAETLEYPEDRSWVIFNMRPEARFSDGTPVTADDVVFSFNALVNEGRPTYKISFKDVESVEALETHRVKFTFRDGVSTRELPSTVGGIPIFSEAYYEDRTFADDTLEPPLGSGPFILKSADPGRSVVYTRNPDYWARDLPVRKGLYNFDEERYEYFADYTSAFENFKAGEYLFREEFSSAVWGTGYDWPALNDGYVIKEVLPDNRPSGTQGWWFNMRRDKFEDPRVRRAIAMMFNFEWSNRTLFYDLYERTNSFWENSTVKAVGRPSEAELALLEPLREHIPDGVFSDEAFVQEVSGDQRMDRRTLRRASRLMDAAGWRIVDGIRQKNGEKFEIEILNDSPSFERIINPYVQNLERLGVIASSPTVDNAQAEEREKNFDFDMVTRRYVLSLTPGPELYGLFGSEGADTVDSANVAGVKNPAVDALIDAINKAPTREELNVAISALDRVLRALHIWVPQWTKGSHTIAYADVFARPETKPLYALGTSTWWWDPEKAERLRLAGEL